MEARANPLGPLMQISQVTVKKTTTASFPRSRTMPWHAVQTPMPSAPGKEEIGKTCLRDPLIKPNQDVTPDSGGEVHLCLEVELDPNRKRGVLEVAVAVDRSLEQVACGDDVSENLPHHGGQGNETKEGPFTDGAVGRAGEAGHGEVVDELGVGLPVVTTEPRGAVPVNGGGGGLGSGHRPAVSMAWRGSIFEKEGLLTGKTCCR